MNFYNICIHFHFKLNNIFLMRKGRFYLFPQQLMFNRWKNNGHLVIRNFEKFSRVIFENPTTNPTVDYFIFPPLQKRRSIFFKKNSLSERKKYLTTYYSFPYVGLLICRF